MDTRSKRKCDEDLQISKKQKEDKYEEKKKKNALKVKTWRAKKKLDQEKYEQMKLKDKERKQIFRHEQRKKADINPEKLEALRNHKCDEMRKYRQNKRRKVSSLNESETNSDSIPLKTRETLTLKKKLAVKRTQKWRMRIQLKNSDEQSAQPQNESACTSGPTVSHFSSRHAKYRNVKKVKSILPTTPKRKAEVVKHLINSPSTSKIITEENVILTPACRRKLSVAETIVSAVKDSITEVNVPPGKDNTKRSAYNIVCGAVLKKSQPKTHAQIRNLSVSYKSKLLKREWWKKALRKTRSDALKESAKQSVKDFFLKAEVSREVPCKKEVVRIKTSEGKKETVQKHVMTMTLEEAHKQYESTHPNSKIGLTAFKKLKPVNVRKISETSRRSCLCQICCNLALKIEAMKKHIKAIVTEDDKETLVNMTIEKKTLSDATFCKYEGSPAVACLTRSCKNCSVEDIDNYLQPVTDKSQGVNVSWHQWGTIEIAKDDKVKRCVSCLPKEGTFDEFLKEVKKDLKVYPEHSFRASWQQKQMTNCVDNLQPGSVAIVMDFSENYGCVFQSEVQSGFFDRNQVTVHPMMCYYKVDTSTVSDPTTASNDPIITNNDLTITGQTLVKHAIIGISEDTKHDADAVLTFDDKALEILVAEGVSINQVHEWTDGCSAQYKGKRSFADISLRQKPEVIRIFLETSHGKNVCDGLGATVKNGCCYRAVISNKTVIGNAQNVFDFCQEKLLISNRENKGSTNSISKREFVLISNIKRNNPESNVATLTGTRKLHAACSTGTDLQLQTRNLSCYCKLCQEDTGDCENEEYVTRWQTRTLKKVTDDQQRKPSQTENNHIAETTTLKKATDDQQKRPSHAEGTEVTADSRTFTDVDTQTIPKAGTFVAVCLKYRRNLANIFIAEIGSVHDSEFEAIYMKRSGNIYIWPEASDISYEPKQHIVGSLSEPSLINERGHFKFNTSEIDTIKCEQLKLFKQVYFR